MKSFKSKLNSNIGKVLDFNGEIMVKFSRKFLNFNSIPQDIIDLAEIVINNGTTKLINDQNEKEFLRLFGLRELKSRVNLWIYLYDKNKVDLSKISTIITDNLKVAGFNELRGYHNGF